MHSNHVQWDVLRCMSADSNSDLDLDLDLASTSLDLVIRGKFLRPRAAWPLAGRLECVSTGDWCWGGGGGVIGHEPRQIG